MTTTTEAWYCTWPRSEDEWVEHCNKARTGGVGISDGPAECWAEFASPSEREAHQREAHPTYWQQIHQPRTPVGETQAAIEVVPERAAGGPPTGAAHDDDPTAKQLAFLAALAERKGVEARPVTSKAEASDEIERLRGLDDADPFRRNQHPGPCSECGGTVAAGEGVLRKDDDTGRWIVGHVSCPDEPTPVPEVPSGYYAVTADEGHTSFYKVVLGRKPGICFVDLLVGGGTNGALVRTPVSVGVRGAVLAKIAAAGIDQAALRFRQESGRCVRCGRGLTAKVSRDEMLGPECRRKV